MNKRSLFSLVLSLLILSLACNLPFVNKGSDDLPEEELSRALNLVNGYDTFFGVLETFDINEYGFPNVLYYTLPEEEIADGIYMQQLYSMDNEGGRGYRAGLNYYLRNDTDSDAYIEVIIDIPKEIALTFDDVTLSQAPLEIIDPDPTGRFGFSLKAKAPPQWSLGIISNITAVPAGYDPDKAFMDMVLTSSARDLCKRKFADDEKLNKEMQDMCYFNVVRDFKDHVDGGDLVWSCASIEDKDLASTCSALLQSDRRGCDAIKDRVNKERCLAVLVNDACLEVPIENRELCIAEGALELKSFGACLEVSEPDIKNDCIARVMGSQKYCDKIADDDLRGQCYYNIGIREADDDTAEQVEKPEESGGGLFSGDTDADTDSGEGNGWFSEETADEVCATIASQIGMPFSEGHANTGHLLCNLSMDNGVDGWPGTVYIWFMNTEEDMKASWDATADSQRYTKDIPNQVYAEHTEDTDFVVAKQQDYSQENKWVYYISAAHLYKNGKIVYTHGSLEEDKRENWNYILSVGREFIDTIGTR